MFEANYITWLIAFNQSSPNKASKRLEAELLTSLSSKKPLEAISLLDFRSSMMVSAVSAQKLRLTCLTGLSATTNLLPSRVLSGKPAQTEENYT